MRYSPRSVVVADASLAAVAITERLKIINSESTRSFAAIRVPADELCVTPVRTRLLTSSCPYQTSEAARPGVVSERMTGRRNGFGVAAEDPPCSARPLRAGS
jgi:hypothetical protein